MRILLITPQLPYPPRQGTSLRNFHILRGLAERHEVSLLSYLEDGDAHDIPEPLAALCARIVTVPAPPPRSTLTRLRQLLRTGHADMALRLRGAALPAALRALPAERAYDIVQIEGLELAWLMPAVREASPRSKIVFDAHNAETLLQERAGAADRGDARRWAAAAYSRLQGGRLRAYEAWALRAADGAAAVSEPDGRFLRALLDDPAKPLVVIPNSIDVAEYAPRPGEAADAPRHDIVFSGKMDYRPNVDAALWFAAEAWPLVRAARPGATWAIVGQKPHARLAPLRELPGVTLTGWVDDVRPYLRGAGCFVMPFRAGSGTRLKLIEALAAELALVSTAVGAEGFPVQNGRELLLAEDGPAFAAAVLRLLDDPALRRALGENGRAFAAAYDWRVVTPRFEGLYAQVLG
jgi:glycosyltransferase involved in cell wall biosynthesis